MGKVKTYANKGSTYNWWSSIYVSRDSVEMWAQPGETDETGRLLQLRALLLINFLSGQYWENPGTGEVYERNRIMHGGFGGKDKS